MVTVWIFKIIRVSPDYGTFESVMWPWTMSNLYGILPEWIISFILTLSVVSLAILILIWSWKEDTLNSESIICLLFLFLLEIFLFNVLTHISKLSFSFIDAVHTLTCALMLLNTDLHGEVKHFYSLRCGEHFLLLTIHSK